MPAGTDKLVNAVSPPHQDPPSSNARWPTLRRGKEFTSSKPNGPRRASSTLVGSSSAASALTSPSVSVDDRRAEVADIVAVLCSEARRFVNGTKVRIDAGSVVAV